MKKFIPLLILLFLSTLSLSAQNRKGTKQRPAKTTETKSESNTSNRSKAVSGDTSNPRINRSFALTSETGFKSLSGWGLQGSYYINPHIAIDLGLGLGVQLVKGGIRGRYLFLDNNFTPYVGAGVFLNPIGFDRFELDLDSQIVLIDTSPSTFGQFVVGAEYMANVGFTVGFNVGYAASFTGDNYMLSETVFPQELSATNKEGLDSVYGSSMSIAFNIGWAF